ncbi:MAG: heme-binding protein [Anaerolineae bacterium]|nr:heme-binding protein [Anaerolineae bacterium]
MWIWILIGLVGAGLLAVAYQAVRAGYESAPYKVVRSDGRVEVRDYAALTVVETPMAADNRDGGFSRLFRFISGGNEASRRSP